MSGSTAGSRRFRFLARRRAPAYPWRRALVTGASSGIGRAMAVDLARAGVDLVVVARDRDRLAALADRLRADHEVEVEILVADLADPDDVARVEHRLGDDGGAPVDLLVNNAGYGLAGDVVDLPGPGEAGVVAVNVVALHRLCHAAATAMVARSAGTGTGAGRPVGAAVGAILNVSSIAGFRPAARAATYGATKAFVNGYSEALAVELAPRGVTVTCLCPGLTRTEFHARAHVDTSSYPRWAWQDAATVAGAGLAGAARGKVSVIPGVHNRVARRLMTLAPVALLRRADQRLRPGTTNA